MSSNYYYIQSEDSCSVIQLIHQSINDYNNILLNTLNPSIIYPNLVIRTFNGQNTIFYIFLPDIDFQNVNYFYKLRIHTLNYFNTVLLKDNQSINIEIKQAINSYKRNADFCLKVETGQNMIYESIVPYFEYPIFNNDEDKNCYITCGNGAPFGLKFSFLL
jgi:hypothetical protein